MVPIGQIDHGGAVNPAAATPLLKTGITLSPFSQLGISPLGFQFPVPLPQTPFYGAHPFFANHQNLMFALQTVQLQQQQLQQQFQQHQLQQMQQDLLQQNQLPKQGQVSFQPLSFYGDGAKMSPTDLLGPAPLFPTPESSVGYQMESDNTDLPPILEPELPFLSLEGSSSDYAKHSIDESGPPLLDQFDNLVQTAEDPDTPEDLEAPQLWQELDPPELNRENSSDEIMQMDDLTVEAAVADTSTETAISIPSAETAVESDKSMSDISMQSPNNENINCEKEESLDIDESGVHSADNSTCSMTEVQQIDVVPSTSLLKEEESISKEEEEKESLSVDKVALLTPVQNITMPTKSRKRAHTTSSKKRTLPKNAKKKKTISSNWVPVGESKIVEFRPQPDKNNQKLECFYAIKHKEADVTVKIRDCVKVLDGEGQENIGKVLRLFIDEKEGCISAQVVWYYNQSQIPSTVELCDRELLASKHFDVINVDSIEDHAFVLSLSEYCRFVAESRIDEMVPEERPLESQEIWSRGDDNYQRRSSLPHEDSPLDMVFFCRNVFSIRTKKICVSIFSRRGSMKSKRPNRTR